MHDGVKLIEETCLPKRPLATFLVEIQLAPLRAGPGRRLSLIDRNRNSVNMKNSGQNQTSEAGAYNFDGQHKQGFHPCDWNSVP